jgi:Domain of unknown function (DUF5658)
MTPQAVRRQFPQPSLTVFVILQVLDILTTLMGIRMGAHEASLFVGQLMNAGPVGGLLLSKIFAVFLVAAAMRFKRPRLVVFLNYWFAAVITWNLAMIVIAQIR